MAYGDTAFFKIRGDKIYVHGTINGKFYRKSTKKKMDWKAKKWLEKADPLKVLAELIGEKPTVEKKEDLESFGKAVLTQHLFNKNYEYQKDVFRVFENYILPKFKYIPLADIKPLDIVSFINSLREDLSPSRLKFVKIVFKIIMDSALENEIIESNPFEKKSVKTIDYGESGKTKAYAAEEVALILKEAKGWFKVFMDLAFKTGMRTGELMGLKWQDFDLENGTLHLQRSITKGVISKSSKNKNHDREIILFPSTVKLLKTYYEVRPSDEWLFVNKDGRYFRESKTIVDYHFKPLLKKVGVEYKTLKATRHTYISLTKLSGNNLKAIQKTVGHKEGSSVTEEHYVDNSIETIEQKRQRAEASEQLFNALLEVE